MIPSSACRARRVISARFHKPAHQKRQKTFVRQVDENDQVYYTLEKPSARGPSPATQTAEFFDMPDLLLDLDAEGSKNVRSYEETDEYLARKKWTTNPKRESVQIKLKELEEQVHESRRRADAMLSQQPSAWRVTNHDILSAALRGAPTEMPQGIDGNSIAESILDRNGESNILEKVRIENGIPEYSRAEDSSFLRWMILRRESLVRTQRSQENVAPTDDQLAVSLKSQTSIAGIRRLVLHYLAAGGGFASLLDDHDKRSSHSAPNLAAEVRSACKHVLDSHQNSHIAVHETLTFIRNLRYNLWHLAQTELCPSQHSLGQFAVELEKLSETTDRPIPAHPR